MMSFNDFLKVFDAYGRYMESQNVTSQAAPLPAQVPAENPIKAVQTPVPATDPVMETLAAMKKQLDQIQTPAPSMETVKPLSVDDVISKIFE